jgi:hypothetical protein
MPAMARLLAPAAALAAALAFGAAQAAPAMPPLPADDETVRTLPDGSTVITITPSAKNEPKEQRTVVEDGRARIDELRVRGQLQRVTVSPKGRAPSYEILVGDGGRDLSDGPSPSRGAVGKRVWNVLQF